MEPAHDHDPAATATPRGGSGPRASPEIDAERSLVSIEDAKLRGAYVDPAAGRVAFAEWAERWERTTVSLRPNTRKDYRTLLKNQVLPAFGSTTLVAIDALAVREWVAELVAGGFSAKRARKAHQVLSQILASAVDGGRLPRNVAEGSSCPRSSARRCTS